MFGKIFIVFLSSFAFIEAAGPYCIGPDGATAVNCQIVPGCNFPENGTLTPLATQCTNQISDADCQQLFPCAGGTAVAPHTTACTRPGAAAVAPNIPVDYPYVRAESCLNPNLQNIALQCARQCALCCQSPAFSCDDDIRSPISCGANTNKCQDPNWTNIMSQYCPRTCGLCTNGTCRDVNTGCNSVASLCSNVDWQTYMRTNCARTCSFCTTTPTTPGCSNIASNCVQNANLCTNSVYRTLMLQQCCATCSGTTAVSVTCVDSNTSCSSWVSNGFCSSTFYTTAQKRQYCARSCNLC